MSLSGRKKVRRFLSDRQRKRLARKKASHHPETTPSYHHAGPAPVDFNKFKDEYQKEVQDSIAFIGQKLDFFTEKKADHLRQLAAKFLGDPSKLKILDVGCGIGITDQYLTGPFGKVYGVDIAKGLVQKAVRLNPKASYKAYDGKRLPYADGSMDVTFTVCVLHHVSPGYRNGFVREMVRVTRKGGLVVIMEHNPLNPLTLRAVNHCDLDDDAILLRMRTTSRLLLRRKIPLVEKRFIFFTPFGGGFFTWLDNFLGWLPLGAQYYVVGQI